MAVSTKSWRTLIHVRLGIWILSYGQWETNRGCRRIASPDLPILRLKDGSELEMTEGKKISDKCVPMLCDINRTVEKWIELRNI